MDRARRRFLLSTVLVAGFAGCQGLKSPPPGFEAGSKNPSPSPTTDSEGSGQESTEPEMNAGTPKTTTTDRERSRTATPSSASPPANQGRTPTEQGQTPKTSTEIQQPSELGPPQSTETTQSHSSEPGQPQTSETKPETTTGTETPTPTETKPDNPPIYEGATIPQFPQGTLPPTGSNFKASDATPVLRASDVTDYGDVDYVADPYLFVEEGTWHMFFEILNKNKAPDAPIGHATSSNGLDWRYDQVVLKKQQHTSFPFIWKSSGSYYMCPPTGKKVELYKAREFPTEWELVGNAIDVDFYPHDPTFVRYKGRWWLFTDRNNENVMVYHSTDIEKEGWTPHEKNPVVTGRRSAGRQGGRPIVIGDRLFLYFQDGAENYGDAVRCYEVTELSPSTYADREMAGSPTLHEFGEEWASNGMHTFDPWWRGQGNGWRCAVDGVRTQESVKDLWTIGIVDIPVSG